MSVGVVGAFPMARRRELFAELQPLVCDLAEHPWRRIAGAAEAHARGHEGSRWNPGKDLSFVPLRPERVLEVRYDHMEGTRFRHPPQFVRWRPGPRPGARAATRSSSGPSASRSTTCWPAGPSVLATRGEQDPHVRMMTDAPFGS